ncbi:MAG: hypothetical protein ACRC2R_01660 [Xenococcaceae cyanobacterium]
MSYCQGETKAQIKFKYPNDTDFPPITTSCNLQLRLIATGSACQGVRNFPDGGIAIGDGGNPGQSNQQFSIPPGNFEAIYNCANSAFFFFKIANSWYNPGSGLFHSCGSPYFANKVATFKLYSNLSVFEINDSRGKVFESIAPSCPIVEIICGDTCPPKTVCECDCGDMTCCWDANGIPIYSFPN